MGKYRYAKPKTKPLVPHVEYNDYGMPVVVVRLPKDATEEQKRKAQAEARQMAKAESSYWP